MPAAEDRNGARGRVRPNMTGQRSVSWPPKGPPGLSEGGAVQGTQAEQGTLEVVELGVRGSQAEFWGVGRGAVG